MMNLYVFFTAFEVYLREPAERHVVNKFLSGVLEFDALPVRHFHDCDEQGVVVVRYERVSARLPRPVSENISQPYLQVVAAHCDFFNRIRAFVPVYPRQPVHKA